MAFLNMEQQTWAFTFGILGTARCRSQQTLADLIFAPQITSALFALATFCVSLLPACSSPS